MSSSSINSSSSSITSAWSTIKVFCLSLTAEMLSLGPESSYAVGLGPSPLGSEPTSKFSVFVEDDSAVSEYNVLDFPPNFLFGLFETLPSNPGT
jgi:hypothetical protein